MATTLNSGLHAMLSARVYLSLIIHFATIIIDLFSERLFELFGSITAGRSVRDIWTVTSTSNRCRY